MSPTAPTRSTVKTGRKKLKLSKETIRDLTAADKEIKGGVPPGDTGDRCNINGHATNGCES